MYPTYYPHLSILLLLCSLYLFPLFFHLPFAVSVLFYYPFLFLLSFTFTFLFLLSLTFIFQPLAFLLLFSSLYFPHLCLCHAFSIGHRFLLLFPFPTIFFPFTHLAIFSFSLPFVCLSEHLSRRWCFRASGQVVNPLGAQTGE